MVSTSQGGVASTGTVTRIDISNGEATHTIPVGLHPTALAFDEKQKRLFIANGNSDSVSVIDTERNSVVETIDIQFFSAKVKGVAPTALALAADGKRLYVACGGINAVAVIDTEISQLAGLIPTGWYPNSVSVSPDGKNLAVTSLLGAGSAWRDEPKQMKPSTAYGLGIKAGAIRLTGAIRWHTPPAVSFGTMRSPVARRRRFTASMRGAWTIRRPPNVRSSSSAGKNGDDFSRIWSIRAPIEPLNKILAANYPSYTNAIPDVVRAQIFLRDLAEYQKNNSLPNLVILQLPSDHTYWVCPRCRSSI